MTIDPPRRNIDRWRTALAVLVMVALPAGCSVQPWVKPYERERIADPLLRPSDDLLSDRHFERVRAEREGARGATGVQGVAGGG